MRMNCSLSMAVSSVSNRPASSWLARITATSLMPLPRRLATKHQCHQPNLW